MTLPLVNLHIIGVQKAGTSALAHFLSQHPDICVVQDKEAHVFDQPDYPKYDTQNFANKRYAKKLQHYNKELIICDATPVTLFNPTFLERCYSYNPSAKFIVILRDPVQRAVSHYYMSKKRRRESNNMLLGFMKEALRLHCVDKSEAWQSGSVWRDNSYLKRGLYREQINNLYSIVAESQCLVLTQETLLAEHDATMSKVFNFLDIPNLKIAQEKIFSSSQNNSDKTERAARLYAALYFTLKGEYPYRY